MSAGSLITQFELEKNGSCKKMCNKNLQWSWFEKRNCKCKCDIIMSHKWHKCDKWYKCDKNVNINVNIYDMNEI